MDDCTLLYFCSQCIYSGMEKTQKPRTCFFRCHWYHSSVSQRIRFWRRVLRCWLTTKPTGTVLMLPVLMLPVLMLPALMLPVLMLPVMLPVPAVSKKVVKLPMLKRVFNLQHLQTGSARLEVYSWLLDILPITAKTAPAVVATVASSLITHDSNRPNRKI